MNTSQEPNPSRQDATSRDMSRPVETQRDMSRYSLSAEVASLRFSSAGVPRSPRTVMRYCQTGHLDCIKIDTDKNERYLITPDSVEKRIEELLSVDLSRQDATGRDETGARQNSTSAAPDTERLVESLQAEIENLERENFDLKITNRGKDEFVKLLREERARFVDELKDQAHRIGQLEERLRLPAGSSPRVDHDSNIEVVNTESPANPDRESPTPESADQSGGGNPRESIHRSDFGSDDSGSMMRSMNGEDENGRTLFS